jgi:hypothetical protein
MASPFFSGRIPQDLYDRIEQHTKETGENKTQVLINALSTYLSYEVPKLGKSNIADIELIKDRISLLELSMVELRENSGTRVKQMSLLDSLPDNADNIPITGADNIDNKPDNDEVIITTKEVTELTGIPRKTLEGYKNRDAFPLSKGKYMIIGYEGKQVHNPHSNLWRVRVTL